MRVRPLLPGRRSPLSQFNKVWRHAAGAVFSVLAPADCRVCAGPLLEAHGFAVCDTCLDLLHPETAALCGRCGERLAVDDVAGVGFSRETGPVCDACETEAPPFVRATAFSAYDGALRTLIRLHKFEGLQELAKPLGSCLVATLQQVALDDADALLHVVAVPLFGKRRRFNQSAQIADIAVREMHAAGGGGARFVLDHKMLRRVRATTSQSHLSPAQRTKNVRGAFAVSGDVSGWTVVLVDDVYTTGATALECTRTLLAAGASAVHVVTLARTQPDRVGRWDDAFA